jgi:hypothetical protein
LIEETYMSMFTNTANAGDSIGALSRRKKNRD